MNQYEENKDYLIVGEELFLVYKDGTKIDLLTSPRFEDD